MSMVIRQNKFSKKCLLIGFLATIMLTGCGKRPKGVLSDDEMLSLIVDLEMAESYVSTYHEDDNDYEMGEAALRNVLAKHKMTKAQFDSTMTWYGKNVDIYQQLLVKADQELSKRQQKISGQVLETALADLWPYSRHYAISPLSSTNNLSFSIPAEDIIPGERLEWKGKLNTIPDGDIILGVEYYSGQTSFAQRDMIGMDKFKMSLQTDTAQRVKRIFGNFHVSGFKEAGSVILLDSLSLGKLPFDSLEYHMIYGLKKFYAPQRKKTAEELAKEKEDSKDGEDDDIEPKTED